MYVDNSFYGTHYAMSVSLQNVFDAPNDVDALPLMEHDFAFLYAVRPVVLAVRPGLGCLAVRPVVLLCNVPLSLEQCRYK